jgi:hypothetical protein
MRPAEPLFLEVRCCCEPMKLLGWLPLPPGVDVVASKQVAFAVGPYFLHLEIAEWEHTEARCGEFGELTRIEGGFAFRSDDTSVEVLRHIAGWIENDGSVTRVNRRPRHTCVSS